MNPNRRTEIVVGVLFVVATVASILGSVALGSALDDADYLVSLSTREGGVIVAAVLFLVAASAAFGTAILLYPILRRAAEGLAVGYVGLRAIENVFYIAGTVALLTMLTVSQDETVGSVGTTTIPMIGATLLALHTWSVVIGTLVFAGLGGLTLNALLYRARLVPRWLAAWGVIGAALVTTYGLIGIAGGDTGMGSPLMILAMPIAVQEMVFAGWLIARGLAPDRGDRFGRSTHDRVEVLV